MEEQNAVVVPVGSYEKAIEAMDIYPNQLAPDPLAPSCNQFRLRPSEEAAILLQQYLNPPPPWGIKINLAQSFIGPEKCLRLGQKMILNRCVTFLDLSLCDLDEPTAEKFFRCLERNTTLLHLSVNGNALKDSGACAAARCVPNLETLHIASNEISDVGACAIATAVKTSGKIKTLNLRNNNITIFGLYKLMDALEPSLGFIPESMQHDILAKDALLTGKELPLEHISIVADVENAAEDKQSVEDDGLEEAPPLDIKEEEPVEKADDVAQESEAAHVDEEEEEIPFNGSLHTLWVDYNDPFPEEVLKSLNLILTKRLPQPPPGAGKKKGKKKAK